MIEGVTLAGAAPTQKSVGEAATQDKKTEAGSTVNLENAQRQQEPDDTRVEAVVRDETVSNNSASGQRLSIGHDDDAGRFFYQALDSVTHEVERQYPPEADLKRSALLKEYLGSLINKTA